MNNGHTPPVLSGCDVLPPMEPAAPSEPPTRGSKTAKRTARRSEAAGRFKVLNTFVDFTLRGLTRNEIAVWLVLYRDTKDGTARTAQSTIADRVGVSIYRKTFTKPVPADGEVFIRKGERFARWNDSKGKARTAKLTTGADGADRIVIEAGTLTGRTGLEPFGLRSLARTLLRFVSDCRHIIRGSRTKYNENSVVSASCLS